MSPALPVNVAMRTIGHSPSLDGRSLPILSPIHVYTMRFGCIRSINCNLCTTKSHGIHRMTCHIELLSIPYEIICNQIATCIAAFILTLMRNSHCGCVYIVHTFTYICTLARLYRHLPFQPFSKQSLLTQTYSITLSYSSAGDNVQYLHFHPHGLKLSYHTN